MIFKLLACEVLTREVCHCIARSPHTFCPVFTKKGEHNVPGRLLKHLQSEIDNTAFDETKYDAILLAYGLCGNATAGLTARDCPLVIPRAHDCTTLFLGSKEAFATHFGDNPSQTWASVGYFERGATLSDDSTRQFLGMGQSYKSLVETYGEENAKYLWESMRTEHGSDSIYFIDVPESRHEDRLEQIRKTAAEDNKKLKTIEGSIRLMDKLLSGDWNEDEFLVIPPGHCLKPTYDMDQVFTAEPVKGGG